MKTFILIHQKARELAIQAINEIKLDGKFKIEIKKVTSKRNEAQNALYQVWTRTMGDELGYNHEEMKAVLVQRHLTPTTAKSMDGRIIEIWPSTTKLTVGEFADFLTKIDIDAATLGINLDKSTDDYYEAIAKYQK